MRYESARTAQGNVGVSFTSQAKADAQAAAMDAGGNRNCSDCFNCSRCSGCSYCLDCSDCSDCSNCSRCSGCSGCSYCLDCSRCSGCSDCSNCSRCSDCSNCSRCSGCSGCSYCLDCSDCSGVLSWRGPKAARLLALNGLRWPVAVSGTHMQIGCENHTCADWAKFKPARIKLMDPDAVAFWAAYKDRLLALCEFQSQKKG